MLPWAVLWIRKSGHIVRLNAEAEQLFGRSLSQLGGHGFYIAI
jgi:nitrogen-specific signal transduction histidine kinase